MTLVRTPYDDFVWAYYTVQQHHDENNHKQRKMTVLMGKSVDGLEVIGFSRAGSCRNNLTKARNWMDCRPVHVDRYETLHDDSLWANWAGSLTRCVRCRCRRLRGLINGALSRANAVLGRTPTLELVSPAHVLAGCSCFFRSLRISTLPL